MAALSMGRVCGPRVTQARPRAALASRGARLHRRWIDLRVRVTTVLIAGRALPPTLWWVAALALWLVLAFAAGICGLATSAL